MDLTLRISDETASGLEYKREEYNKERGSNLSLEEFILSTLSDWSRHALGKKRKLETEQLARAIMSLSKEDQGKISEAINGSIDIPG